MRVNQIYNEIVFTGNNHGIVCCEGVLCLSSFSLLDRSLVCAINPKCEIAILVILQESVHSTKRAQR